MVVLGGGLVNGPSGSVLGVRLVGVRIARGADGDEAQQREFFERRIRPALVRYCYECHSVAAAEPKGNLRVDSRVGITRGGQSGAAVVPGHPEDSLLLQAMRHDGLEMPPGKRLPEPILADFENWIRQGAFDPRDSAGDPGSTLEMLRSLQWEDRRDWWSLQPLPAGNRSPEAALHGLVNRIDLWLQSAKQQRGLTSAPPADQRVLARRLSFTLRGIPPATDEAEGDVNIDASDRLLDQYLASPHLGEHWARHWMDVVRYTDTYGYEWDIPAKGAWRYRDYLTRAFNRDVGFDQLVREQIAGDLLESPRLDHDEQLNESLLGVMFYQLGEKRHGDSAEFDGIHQEMLDNKIDALSKAFQATTVACARCHDHKLDAVLQSEYYALGGALISSRWVTNTVDLPDRFRPHFALLHDHKSRLRELLAAGWRAELAKLRTFLASPPPAETASNAADPVATPAERWRRLFLERKEPAPPLEDPLRIWQAMRDAREPDAIAAAWRGLRAEYDSQSRERQAANQRDFLQIADLSTGLPVGWSIDGAALDEPVPVGDFALLASGENALMHFSLGGRSTGAYSPRMNGALRSPFLRTFDRAFLSFELVGGDFAAVRTVVDNAFLTERQQYLNHPFPGWLVQPTLGQFKDRNVYLEIATKTSNPNFPPRVGLGGACSEEQAADPRSWWGVSRIFAHNGSAPPADELERFTTLWGDSDPDSTEAVAGRFCDWFDKAIERWQRGAPSRDDVRLLNWMLQRELISNRLRELPEDTRRSVEQYRQLESQLPSPRTANGMADIDPGVDYRLNVRGEYADLADPVPRGFVRAISERAGDGTANRFSAPGSGRLELAQIVASPKNPLTARVYANRVWQWMFGDGLVRTPDDFGHLGDPPLHRELLDELASELIAGEWSSKRLIRRLAHSSTWRQSSRIDPEAAAADADNRCYHHYPLRRLEAESIRDAMLAASGLLDRQLYGPPINPYRVNEDPQKRLFSGPVEGQFRRSLYTKVTIMEPPRFLAIFNQPAPKIPTGKRDVTNTPAQSLALLNDPTVVALASAWGKQLASAPPQAVAERLRDGFRAALSREPNADELARWETLASDLAAMHGMSPEQVTGSEAVWSDLAHALFNLKEFVYLR